MDENIEENNIIQASGSIEDSKNNNNYNFESNTKRQNEAQEKIEKRKRLCSQYIFQQDYQEALRSLLWEPYECRDNFNAWYYGDTDNKGYNGLPLEVPKRMFLSSSDSSITASSNCFSNDEILTTSVEQRSAFHLVRKSSLNLDALKNCKKEMLSTMTKKLGRDLKQSRTIDANALLYESELKGEEQFSWDFKRKCTTDPDQSQMNIRIMVSDLHLKNGDVISSYNGRREAQQLHSIEIGASASQFEFGCCMVGCNVCDQEENDLNAEYKMLVTVEGTLEPRDSNEGTHLVSPDTSLDLSDNPTRLSGLNRTEPGPSCGNVSVVNCYRAVPVSVVSTVPIIKCLNTQETVSNINVIQTISSPTEKSSATKYPQVSPKRRITRPNNGPVPSTSRVLTKILTRDADRNQIRQEAGLEQNSMSTKIEKPNSANTCVTEMKNEQRGQIPSLNWTTPTDSNNDSIMRQNNDSIPISNHSRSISNPVLGNQMKSLQNKFGSQQNIPVRLETHFNTNDAEQSQTYLFQGSTSKVESTPQTEVLQEAESEPSKPSSRTFTSTEAQTDDVPLGIHSGNVINREQRRRERRERRHQRRLNQNVLNSGSVWQTNVDIMHRDRRGLPDILNSHMPPPYSAVSVPAIPTMSAPIHVPPPMPVPPTPQTVPHLVEPPPGQPLPHQNSFRFPFPFPGVGRRAQGQVFAREEETPKSCCGVVVTQTISIRWFIIMICFVGVCCVVVGTALGASGKWSSGREHLTVSLLMIGVGIVLVTVSVVAWRLTSPDLPSCRSILGLGSVNDSGNEPNQRFVPRMPPSYGRPHHPYAAMMYPEFQYRPPPPSYQASMQEYRLRLLLLERPNDTTAGLQATVSPPPTYRSQAGSTLGLRPPPLRRSLPQSEYSHPPSYRSRTSSTRPTLDPNGDTLGSVNHSRNSSLLSHVSDQNGNVSQAVVNVISVMGNTVDLRRGDSDLQMDSIKVGVEEEVPIPPLRMLLNKGKHSPTGSLEETKSENVNLVTIVTVSDSNNSAPNRDHSVESDVLAHL